MTSKGSRKANGSFELAESPLHLMRLCQQYYGDLYARESGARDLTKQQFTLLCVLEHRDGVSQTTLVETTGIDRSTLAEMVRARAGIVEEEDAASARGKLRETVAQYVLDEREQRVVQMYYEFELSYKEIAAVLNLTDARVCQLNKGALRKMKTFLQAA